MVKNVHFLATVLVDFVPINFSQHLHKIMRLFIGQLYCWLIIHYRNNKKYVDYVIGHNNAPGGHRWFGKVTLAGDLK